MIDSQTKKILIQILILAVLSTFLSSLIYKRPPNCERGFCEPGEQVAGYPFHFVRDQGLTGSSPTNYWYKLDWGDYLGPNLNLLTCGLDIFFTVRYSHSSGQWCHL